METKCTRKYIIFLERSFRCHAKNLASFIQPLGRVIEKLGEIYQKLLFSLLKKKKGSPTLFPFPCFLFAFGLLFTSSSQVFSLLKLEDG